MHIVWSPVSLQQRKNYTSFLVNVQEMWTFNKEFDMTSVSFCACVCARAREGESACMFVRTVCGMCMLTCMCMISQPLLGVPSLAMLPKTNIIPLRQFLKQEGFVDADIIINSAPQIHTHTEVVCIKRRCGLLLTNELLVILSLNSLAKFYLPPSWEWVVPIRSKTRYCQPMSCRGSTSNWRL